MKQKFNYLLILLCLYGNAQNASPFYSNNFSQTEEQCSYLTPSNDFESIEWINGWLLANDFYVNANMQFEANVLKVNIIHPIYQDPDILGGVSFYEDNLNSSGPGNFIGDATLPGEGAPTAYTLLGNYDETNLVYEYVFEFEPWQFDGGAMGTRFWLGFFINNGSFESPSYWETTSILNSDHGIYFPGNSGWELMASNYDCVFELLGNCNALSIPSFDETEIFVVPNPVKDILKISYPLDKSLSVILTNISGQVLSETSDRVVEMSRFSIGLYFLKLSDSFGNSKLFKIIKN